MTSGVGASASFRLPNFDQYQTLGAKTLIELRLPFGLPGLQSSFEIAVDSSRWQATFIPDHLPISAVLVHLDDLKGIFDDEGHLVAVQSGSATNYGAGKAAVISLSPDRWGRSWRTRAQLEVDSFIGFDYGSPNPSTTEEIAGLVLTPACRCLNRVLDTLAFVGGIPDLPHLTPSDFWSVNVRYIGQSSEILGSFSLSGLQTIWWGAYRSALYDAEASLRGALANPDGLSIVDELLITSERKAHAGDYRGAIIDAVCAVESAVGQYLDDFLKRQGIAPRLRKEFLGPHGVSLSLRVAVLIPAFVQLGIPTEIVDAFRESNNKRNNIVHKGESAALSQAERARAAATMFIDCLRGFSLVKPYWDSRRSRQPLTI